MSPIDGASEDEEMDHNDPDTGQSTNMAKKDHSDKSSPTNSGTTTTRTRLRQYPKGHPGPFVVHIRQDVHQLKHLQIARDLNSKLKSIQTCEKKSSSKVTVTLLDIKEANSIPTMECLSDYHVYIPAEDVEVEGVFDLPPEVEIEEIMDEGSGKFSHPDIPAIRPLDLYRFKRTVILPNGEPMEQDTNSVKVTFAGKALPRYMVIYNLLIKIRPYDRKAMFCNNCSSINHTQKFCTRKTCCLKCGQDHLTKDCGSSVAQTVCKLCKETHPPDIRKCPKFVKASKGRKEKQIQSIKSSYADMVKQYDTTPEKTSANNRFSWLHEMELEEEESDSNKNQHGNPYKRQRSMNHNGVRQIDKALLRSPTRRKTTASRETFDRERSSQGRSTNSVVPPGFKKTGNDSRTFSVLKDAIVSIVDSLKINPRFAPMVTLCINLFFDTVLPLLIQNVSSLQTDGRDGS